MTRAVLAMAVFAWLPLTVHAQVERPAKDPASHENLVWFDCDRAEVVWTQHHWQLQAGGILLKDFGRRETEARHALRLVRELRLNQYGTIGSPAPVLEYWLSDGHAPRGSTAGLRTVSFDVTALKVECIGGQWCLNESRKLLFRFGRRAEDAQEALTVLKRHGFTRVAMLGQAAPAMLIFLAGDADVPSLHGQRRSIVRTSNRNAREERDTVKAGNGLESLQYPEVAPLRTAAQPQPGPRTPFAGGQIHQLPSGRRLGALPPQPDVTKLADRVAFDSSQVQVRRAENGWVLAAGSHVLARFGEREFEAQQALSLLHGLRLTDQLAVGQPVCFSYFLASGRPPHVPLGLEVRAFQPDALIVRQVDNAWAICDNAEPLLSFGASASDARKFLDVMRKDRLDRIYRLGISPEEGFTLLMRGR